MSGTVSTRWYFTDWMSDPNVRSCSLAARGLWMDLLCIAGSNRNKEHGFVLIAGRIPLVAQLARLLGSTETEITTLLSELEANKVFNKDRRGAIYSRRMVRAEKSRANGRLSTEINQRSDRLGTFSKPIKTKENKKQPPPPIPEPEPEPLKKEDSLALTGGEDRAPRDDYPKDYFERFWMLYPPGRKSGKKAVAKKLEGVRRRGEVSFERLMVGLQRFVNSRPDPQFTKAPEVWLNKGCWDDEYQERSNGNGTQADRVGGRGTASTLAAKIRAQIRDRELRAGEPACDTQSPDRCRDPEPGLERMGPGEWAKTTAPVIEH